MKLATLDALAACTLPGRHSTKEKNLYMNVSPTGARTWLARCWQDGKARNSILGPVPDQVDGAAFDDARDKLHAFQKSLRAGAVGPVRRSTTDAYADNRFEPVARAWMAANLSQFKNPEHVADWPGTLEKHVFPFIGKIRIPEIAPQDIADMQKEMCAQGVERVRAKLAAEGKPFVNGEHNLAMQETADRVRQRVHVVIEAYFAAKNLNLANPARKSVTSKLFKLVPKKKRRVHFKKLAYARMPQFMAKLRTFESTSAKAAQFAILTAARTNEVRNLQWKHIDLDLRLWTIPAALMKMARIHTVPLSDAAMDILLAMPKGKPDAYVFEGGATGKAKQGKPLGANAIRKCIEAFFDEFGTFTVHGMRGSFRTWAADRRVEERAVLESCLAHAMEEESEEAYNDSDYLVRRTGVMQLWGAYLAAPAAPNVVAFPEKRAA